MQPAIRSADEGNSGNYGGRSVVIHTSAVLGQGCVPEFFASGQFHRGHSSRRESVIKIAVIGGATPNDTSHASEECVRAWRRRRSDIGLPHQRTFLIRVERDNVAIFSGRDEKPLTTRQRFQNRRVADVEVRTLYGRAIFGFVRTVAAAQKSVVSLRLVDPKR